MFDLLLQFVILLALASFFLSFFLFRSKKITRPKLVRPIFYRLNDLILGRFKGNTTFFSETSFDFQIRGIN